MQQRRREKIMQITITYSKNKTIYMVRLEVYVHRRKRRESFQYDQNRDYNEQCSGTKIENPPPPNINPQSPNLCGSDPDPKLDTKYRLLTFAQKCVIFGFSLDRHLGSTSG